MKASQDNTAHVPPGLLAALRRAWGRTWRREAEREATERENGQERAE